MAGLALDADALRRLRRILDGRHGVDLSYYTESFLGRRVAARMRELGLSAASDYLSRLEGDPAEMDSFVSSLTINVTEFFRDGNAYAALRDAALPLLFSGTPRHITAWSAGCATGEEPYTLAMLLAEAASQRPGFAWSLRATDISPRQVKAAQEGVYPSGAMAKVPERYRKDSFTEVGGGRIRISPRIRSNVRFLVHDLSAEPPLRGPFDLILCRNVMIYFATQAKDKILSAFHRSLRPGGFLVLGGSEVILNDRLFKPLDMNNKIYRPAPRPPASTGEPLT